MSQIENRPLIPVEEKRTLLDLAGAIYVKVASALMDQCIVLRKLNAELDELSSKERFGDRGKVLQSDIQKTKDAVAERKLMLAAVRAEILSIDPEAVNPYEYV